MRSFTRGVRMVAQITISIANVDILLSSGFTDLEILKQTDSGSYTLITSHVPVSAHIQTTPASTLYKVGGKSIGLSIDGAPEVLISFDPTLSYWSPSQVSSRINEVLPGAASAVSNFVRISSPTSGRGSSVQATYSTASDLGLSVGFVSIGIDQSPTLSSGNYIYNYMDVSGSVGDKYKWRFTNHGIAPISAQYGPIVGGELIPPGVAVSVATANFIGLDGRAKKTSVIIAMDRPPTLNGSVATTFDRSLTYSSDDAGFLQIPLVKGSIVRVAIEGTSYIREITVPDTDTFDLLNAMSTAPDPFTVQTTPPYLIRRNI